MQINVSIQLSEGDDLTKSPDELAANVLEAIGGSPEGDYCTVTVMPPVTRASVGTPLISPPQEEPADEQSS